MILFFDTETTGKADFNAEPHAPHQPRLVQFAGLLADDDGNEVSSANLVIKPDGFTIPESASAIHGITNAKALAVGVDCTVARQIFRNWWACSKLIVAHNINFDLFIMDGELFRKAGGRKPWGEPKDTFCTMQAMTQICKIPGKYGTYKWPKLQEAYHHCFGCDFDSAHDAMADVRACFKIYRWLKLEKEHERNPGDGQK